MSTGTTAGYYEAHPLLVNVALRFAARRAGLSAADKASLNTILSSNANLVIAGELMDEAQAASSVSGGNLGAGGQIIQILIANLPAIIAAIIQIINAMHPPAAHAALGAEHAKLGFAVPPAVVALLEQAALAAAKAVLPTVEEELVTWLQEIGVLPAAA